MEQDPNDPPASELLKTIEAEKQQLHATSSPHACPRADGERGSRNLSNLDSRVRGNDGMKIKSLPPIKPEEMPYELPRGWEWVRLQDVSTKIHYGYTASAEYNNQNVRLLRITDIQNSKVDWETVPGCNARKEEVDQYLLTDNDILIARTGGTVGKSYVVQGINVDAVFASYLIRVIPSIHMDVRFIKYFAEGPLYWRQLYAACSGTGQPNVNGTSLSQLLLALPSLPEQHRIVAKIDQLMAKCDELEKLRKERQEKRLAVHAAAVKQLLDSASSPAQPLSSPPRRRGASASDSLDSRSPSARGQACGNDGAKNAWGFIQQHFGKLYSVKENVAELRKAILQLAVMGRLVPQDPNDPPASELLKVIEAEKQQLHATSSPRRRGSTEGKNLDSRVRGNDGIKIKSLPPIKPEEVPYELPRGWEWVRLGELIELVSGQHLTPDEYNEDGVGYPYYTGPADFGIVNPTATRWTKIERAIALQGDILLTVKGAGVGKTNILTDDMAAISRQLMALRVARVNRDYVLIFLCTIFYEFQSLAVGIAIPGINRNDVLLRKFPLPPLPEQHRIVARIDQLMALCDQLEQQIDAATGKQTELLNALMAQV